MLDDTSEGRAVSAEVARMERRGVVVTSIEQGPVVRESSTWGWGRVPAELVQTTWVAHLGGAPAGATVTFRQKVWTFSDLKSPGLWQSDPPADQQNRVPSTRTSRRVVTPASGGSTTRSSKRSPSTLRPLASTARIL